ARRVFTNRNLRLESLGAFGFDMDHTLAIYDTRQFDRLSFELALDGVLRRLDLPPEVRDVRWDPAAAVRGLVVDKKSGNLLKVDAYHHVTRARHGEKFLDKEERRDLYASGRVRLGTGRYRSFDTLFDLPEGSLYTALVARVDAVAAGRSRPDYRALSEGVRAAVDGTHADGSLKSHITADLDRFFTRDPHLVPTLQKFRDAGKKLFLLTNSEPSYTGAVMQHLVGGEPGSWVGLFDLVICSAGKPGFFVKRGDGEPIPVGQDARLPNRNGNCFLGGDSFFLEKQLGISGDGILYFGDHTYGDILRSKKSVGWRTAMIIPEVEEELQALVPLIETLRELGRVEKSLDDLVMRKDHLRTGGGDPDEIAALTALVTQGLGRRGGLQRKIKSAFNPHWESVFREGRAASRLGRQVMEFACIYTSRVSNFLNYPTDKFFARPVEILPHERGILPES
ncbi:HAD family hydrolase, partial [bacterium CG17_big_fil_post_rev_8_21_14_2_50_64_8]